VRGRRCDASGVSSHLGLGMRFVDDFAPVHSDGVTEKGLGADELILAIVGRVVVVYSCGRVDEMVVRSEMEVKRVVESREDEAESVIMA
jgi:hypothetical protein